MCLSVILIDSVFRTGKNYCPQVLLEKCKYLLKKKRYLSILLSIFLLIVIEKILMKKSLMTKVLTNEWIKSGKDVYIMTNTY